MWNFLIWNFAAALFETFSKSFKFQVLTRVGMKRDVRFSALYKAKQLPCYLIVIKLLL